MSPTQRSKKFLEDRGYKVAIVEHWNHWAKCRQDLFQIGDLLAIKAGVPPILVQTTTADNMAKRIAKNPEMVKLWCSTGAKFEFHSWGKYGKAGQRKLWEIRIKEPITG